MAETPKTTTAAKATETAAPAPADHDRVVGLSVAKDGTLDQHDPEIIGDKDAALAATKRQFSEIAVAAIDADKRAELGLAGTQEGDTSDAAIDALKAEQDKAVAAAEKQAEKVVNELHKG